MKVYWIVCVVTTVLLGCQQSQPDDSMSFEISGNKLTEETDSSFLAEGETPESAAGREVSFQLIDYVIPSAKDSAQIKSVDRPMAIFVYPSESEIRRLQLELGDNLPTVADDNAFYLSQASDWLDSLQTPRIVLDTRYIWFKKSSVETLLFDTRAKKAPFWNLILFNPPQEPLIVNPVELTREDLHRYFGKPVPGTGESVTSQSVNGQ